MSDKKIADMTLEELGDYGEELSELYYGAGEGQGLDLCGVETQLESVLFVAPTEDQGQLTEFMDDIRFYKEEVQRITTEIESWAASRTIDVEEEADNKVAMEKRELVKKREGVLQEIEALNSIVLEINKRLDVLRTKYGS